MENTPSPALDARALDPTVAPPPDRVERNLRMLDRLAELGMEQAEAIHRGVIAAAAAPDPSGVAAADLGVKFTRIARSIGQTVALSTKIMNDQKAASQPRPDIDRRRRAAIRAEEYRRKDRVRDTVELAVRAHAPPGKVYDLLIELDGRLDDPALEPDLDAGRLSRIVLDICKDFGVEANFDDWSDEECGFVVPHHSTVNIPPGVDPAGWFSRPPGQTLTEIILEAAAARKAEAEAKTASPPELDARELDAQELDAQELDAQEPDAREPDAQEIEPSPD